MNTASELAPSFAPMCSRHPGVSSIATCARCGSFLCHPCRARMDPDQCEACTAITSDPLQVRSAAFSIGGSLSGGWKLFTQTLPVVAVMSVVFGIPSGLLSFALSGAEGNFDRVTNLYDALIGLIGTIGVVWAMAGVAEGRKVSVGEAFSQGLGSWGRVFGARFRTGLWVLLFALLLIVPGVIKGLALLLVTPLAVLNRGGDPLDTSTQLTRGFKGELFLLCLAGGAIMLVTVMPVGFGIGLAMEFVPATALPMEILLDVVVRASGYFFEAITLAAYYGLTRSHQQARA